MSAIRRRDTQFELEVRSLLHAAGLRFRVDLPIRLEGMRPIRPDVVFTRRRVAVFCDGCFWHGCPEHGQRPNVRNGHYWTPKIEGNRERDARHTAALESAGWTVLRFWEHEDVGVVAAGITETVAEATSVRRLPATPQANRPPFQERSG
jgi:DNA mismatch endonuclease (patch repair protein)